jgi:hypothetical protein
LLDAIRAGHPEAPANEGTEAALEWLALELQSSYQSKSVGV